MMDRRERRVRPSQAETPTVCHATNQVNVFTGRCVLFATKEKTDLVTTGAGKVKKLLA